MRLQDDIGTTREDISQHFTPGSHSDLTVAALLLFSFSELRSPSCSEQCVTFFSLASQILQMEGRVPRIRPIVAVY
jgi:hypothetical protein